FRQQIPRSSRITLDLAPKRSDEHAQVLGLVDGIWSPDGLQNGAMCEHPARMLREEQQEIEFLWREPDLLAATEDAPPIPIDHEIAACNLPLWCARRFDAAQRDPDPRHQFLGPERFRHVIVGAGIKRGNLVRFLSPRRQDDDWRCAAVANESADLNPAAITQSEIEHDQSRPVAFEGVQRSASAHRG